MSSPFQQSFSTPRQHNGIHDTDHPQGVTYARVAASSSSTRTGSSSRIGPAAFSNILNPTENGFVTTYLTAGFPASSRHYHYNDHHHNNRHELELDNMTQNGGDLDTAAGNSFGGEPSRQLPASSRAFELFMTRATLDTLPVVEPVLNGRSEPLPVPTSPRIDQTSFPRPSYLEGSSYLEKLEQQARRKALLQMRTTGAQTNNGSTQGGKASAPQSYHLGIARDVVEGVALPEQDDDAIDALPTRWSTAKEDKAAGLEVLSDGLEVKFTAAKSPSERDHEACAIRADNFMPLQCGLYYYEVTILSRKHNDTTIGIGFSGKNVSMNRAPGWEPESWGYHGDDGHIFASQNVGKNYGPTFSVGDTIGCGVNFRTHTAFFTKNGKHLGQAFAEVKGKLYPSVGLKKPGEHIRVNFGQTEFIYDINGLMKQDDRPLRRTASVSPRSFGSSALMLSTFSSSSAPIWSSLDAPQCSSGGLKVEAPDRASDKAPYYTLDSFLYLWGQLYWTVYGWFEIGRLEKEISKADTSRLAPPLDETDLIQQLVLQFLQHDGYVDTARAFAQEIQTEKQSLSLDPDYQVPGINIKDDEHANNRQRIRRAVLEGDIDKALRYMNTYYPQVLQKNEQVYFRLRCRKFIEMIRREAEMNLVGGDKRSHNGHFHPPEAEDMELDDDMDDFDGQRDQGGSGDLTQVALAYGQTLQAEYAGDERRGVRQALEDIFSLIAYQNPLKESKVAHLLDRKGRVAVAEELNSAILQSLGKSSRAAIENMYAQTSVLLDDLAKNGGPGAFVTMKSIIDEIEPNKTDF
ncbi:CTLH/CRA C-terminal to lish motif domain-domain-containing protein [Coniella lustricola]|uniref:CTLH/CRA C-terminal to lish motif domain-domain-containing protein n=1 Tax=Coniella lustricola TaxID=2025994 RepID=A0A2T3A9N2_9PEZI|nr:CTLH/CRA C-terminal to lish motif domain-domain-containing protein [Coniella lustricola]